MKSILHLTLLISICFQSYGQMIMTAEGINPDNVCKSNTVYFLMTDKAKPTESVDSIEIRINTIITFVKDNPNFKSTPAV